MDVHVTEPREDLCKLLYSPTQIRFPIGVERVTCRGSKLANSLGKQQLELSTRTWSCRAPWNRGKFVSQPALSSERFLRIFSYFELGGITKHLMTGSARNSEFCVPSTSMRVSGKQNSLFPLGQSLRAYYSIFSWPNLSPVNISNLSIG